MKTCKRILMAMLVLTTIITCLLAASASAASTLSISSPGNDTVWSWESPPSKIKWKAVDGAAGYYVTIKNHNEGTYLVQNAYTTNLYYPCSKLFPAKRALYKIWVGAVRSASESGAAAFTSDVTWIGMSHEPDVTLDGYSNVTQDSITLTMSINADYGSSLLDSGFYVGTSSSVSRMTQYSFQDYGSYSATTKGTKTMKITGLEPGTKYYFRAYAENEAGEEYTDYDYCTTKTSGLSVSQSSISFGADSTRNVMITVTCDGSYSYSLEYNGVTAAQKESYNYEWLSVSKSDSTITVKPTRENFAPIARSATLTVSSNGTSKSVEISQSASSEGTPKLIFTNSITSTTEQYPSETNFGIYGDSGQDIMYLYAYGQNIRRLVINTKKTGTNELVRQDVFDLGGGTSHKSTFIPIQNKNGGGLDVGDYYAECWASTSSVSEDLWSQRTSAIKFYFSIQHVQLAPLDDVRVVSPVDSDTLPAYKSIVLDWDPVSGAEGYHYIIKRLQGMPDRSNDNEPYVKDCIWEDDTDASTTSYTLSGSNVKPGSWYKFVVSAFASGVDPSWSKWTYCYIMPETLEKPEVVSPSPWSTLTAGNSILFDWNDATGASKYHYYIKQLSGKPDTNNDNEPCIAYWDDEVGSSTTRYTLSGSNVKAGYWYKFVVSASSDDERVKWSDWIYVYIAPQAEPLARPVITAPVTGSNECREGSSITLRWNPVSGAQGYEYHIKQLVGEPNNSSSNEQAVNEWVGKVPSGTTRKTLSGTNVVGGYWYKFVVAAYNDTETSWSKYIYVKIPEKVDWIHYVLPAGMDTVSVESFADNTQLRTFDASKSQLGIIESRAFYGCGNLIKVNLPETVWSIAEDAFEGCPNVVIYCNAGSDAHLYAQAHNIQTVLTGNIIEENSITLSASDWSGIVADGARRVITVSSTDAWTAEANASWIRLTPASGGSGNTNVVVEATANTGASFRSGKVVFTGTNCSATLNVRQNTGAAAECSLKLSKSEWSTSASKQTTEFFVEYDGSYTVASNQSWLICTKSAGTVTVTAAQNTGSASRSGTITVKDGCGSAAYFSVTQSGTTGTTATQLAAPYSVSASAASPSRILISWTKVQGAAGYHIYRSEANDSFVKVNTISGGSSLTCQDAGLNADTSYAYKVQAYASNGTNGELSSSISCKTPRLGEIVFGGKYAGKGNGAILSLSDASVFSWSAYGGATSYQLSIRCLDTNAVVLQPTKPSGLSMNISSYLTVGVPYRVWIAGYNDFGDMLAQSQISFTVGPVPEVTITSPTAGATITSSFSVAWNAVNKVDYYVLQVAEANRTDPNDYIVNEDHMTSRQSDPISISRLKANTSYNIWVQAWMQDANGDPLVVLAQKLMQVATGSFSSHDCKIVEIIRPVLGGTSKLTFGHYVNYYNNLNTYPHREHRGNDFSFNNGDPGAAILAAAGGRVTRKGAELSKENGRGYYVQITDDNGILYTYMHMYEPAYANKGDIVTKGQLIGTVGTTGSSTGEHLHFQAEIGGAYLNTNTSRDKICVHGGVKIDQNAYIIPYKQRNHYSDEDFNGAVIPKDVGYQLNYTTVGAGTIPHNLEVTCMVPTNVRKGDSFIVRGLVSSRYRIKTIRLTIENDAGTPIAGFDRTATVNAYLYDLKNLDSGFKFGSLTTGVYRYHIQAIDENGYELNGNGTLYSLKCK